MAKEINIYGAVRSKTTDGKAAFAGQVYDENENAFQDDINAHTLRDITETQFNAIFN